MPPQKFIESIGSTDPDNFNLVGDHLFEIIRQHCKITPQSNILDIGSGCGRVAIRFADYLTTGEYDGIDVVLPMVEWCRQNISSQRKNFSFHYAALTNTLYSQEGESATTYQFPFPDERFDTTFATSVFTHLVLLSAENYAREVARTLKPGGKAFLTFFLMTPDRDEMLKIGAKILAFPYRKDGFGAMVEDDPERVSAFTVDLATGILTGAGLKILEISYGNWDGKPHGWTYQDAFLVSR